MTVPNFVPADTGISLGTTLSNAGTSISGAVSDAGKSLGITTGSGGTGIFGGISFGGDGAAGTEDGIGAGDVAKDAKAALGMASKGKKGDWAKAQFVSHGPPDWRVKITVPKDYMTLAGDGMLKPLKSTDDCVVFPYTPTILMQQQVAYNPIKPIHSNFPFYAYQNSSIDQLSITGEFTVETIDEGKYWIAMRHFFHSASKMAYGENSILPTGSPPPVLKLNGYGDHIFNNTSIIIQSFQITMDPDIDYMLIKDFHGDKEGTYVPVKSVVNLGTNLVHSRQKVKTFSLDSFVKGDYVKTGEFI